MRRGRKCRAGGFAISTNSGFSRPSSTLQMQVTRSRLVGQAIFIVITGVWHRHPLRRSPSPDATDFPPPPMENSGKRLHLSGSVLKRRRRRHLPGNADVPVGIFLGTATSPSASSWERRRPRRHLLSPPTHPKFSPTSYRIPLTPTAPVGRICASSGC